jgi:hypothetical protein
MISATMNGQTHEFEEHTMILEAARSLGCNPPVCAGSALCRQKVIRVSRRLVTRRSLTA